LFLAPNTVEVAAIAPAGGTTLVTCEHLICAHCAAPVVEGRCPACQAARAHVHRPLAGLHLPLTAVILITLLLLLVALQVAR
jgi:hypothetical protein